MTLLLLLYKTYCFVMIITGRWYYILEQVSLPSWTEQILSKTKDTQARICYLSLCWHSVVPGKMSVHFFESRMIYTRSFLSLWWLQSVSWSGSQLVGQSVAGSSRHQMDSLFVFSQAVSVLLYMHMFVFCAGDWFSRKEQRWSETRPWRPYF